MPKKTPPPKTGPRLPVFLFVAIIVVALLIGVNTMGVWRSFGNGDKVGAMDLTQQIIMAASATKQDVPVDPKTGDMYFPQARLYVPAPQQTTPLTYSYDRDSQGHELSVSNRFVFSQNASRLYSAQHLDQVFEAVPQLQACQRGVEVATSTQPDKEKTLAATVQTDAETVYLYTEKKCPDLSHTVNVLKTLRSY